MIAVLSLSRRRRAHRRLPTSRRAGVSVIEIMIAVTLLGIVMMSLGKLSVMVTQRGRTNELVASRSFALQQQANKFTSMPYDSIVTFPTTSRTITAGGFSYTRRLTISQPVAGVSRYQVKVVVIPSSDTTKKDSLVIDRVKAATGSPLCAGCP